jgi:hypothetical protein
MQWVASSSRKTVSDANVRKWITKASVVNCFALFLKETIIEELFNNKAARDALYSVTVRSVHFWVLCIRGEQP